MGQRGRILVVDDDESIRELAQLVLEGAGHVVAIAGDGGDGIQQVSAFKPDVVLLDMMMPEVDGLEFLNRLPLECAPPLPRIIASSGFDKFEQLALERGASGFLRKPYETNALLEAVAACLDDTRPDVRFADRQRAYVAVVRAEAQRRRENILRNARLDDPSLLLQLERFVHWAAGYFNVAQALVTILQVDRLLVLAQHPAIANAQLRTVNQEDSFNTETAIHASPWIIRDAVGHPAFSDHPAAARMPSYAGAPLLTSNRISIGSLSVIHDRPHDFRAEDLALLAYFGQILGESIEALSDGRAVRPVFEAERLFASEFMESLVDAELRRAERDRGTVEVVVLAARPSAELLRTAVLAAGAYRLAMARHNSEQTVLLMGDGDQRTARARMDVLLAVLVESNAPERVGTASFHGTSSVRISAHEFISAAAATCDRARR